MTPSSFPPARTNRSTPDPTPRLPHVSCCLYSSGNRRRRVRVTCAAGDWTRRAPPSSRSSSRCRRDLPSSRCAAVSVLALQARRQRPRPRPARSPPSSPSRAALAQGSQGRAPSRWWSPLLSLLLRLGIPFLQSNGGGAAGGFVPGGRGTAR